MLQARKQEILAVVHAFELWHCYFDGQDFTVVTAAADQQNVRTSWLCGDRLAMIKHS